MRGNGGKLVGVSSPAIDVEEPESADASGSTDQLLAAIVAGEPETGRFGARLPRRDRGRGWLMRRALAAADVLGLTLAFGFSLVVFAGSGPYNELSDALELAIFALSMPFWIIVAKLYGLYASDEERTDHSTADDIVGVFHLVTVGSWLLFIVISLTGVANPSVVRVVSFWLFAIVLVTSFRALARVLVRHSRTFIQNTVIVGAGEVGQLVAHKILQHPEYGINVVGFVDDNPVERREGLGELAILGPSDSLLPLVGELGIERVIFAFSSETHEHTLDLIRALDHLHVRIDIVPRLFEVFGPDVACHTVEGVPLLGLPSGRLSRSSLLLKRVFDFLFAVSAIAFLSPILVAVAVAIKLDSRGPILFRQTRMGEGERVFSIFKFRTMHYDADARKGEVAHLNKHVDGDPRMFKIPNDPRITRVGAFVRRYSLDELPQLLNVVRGEMSIVGPRPLILEEDQHVVDWRRRRLHLKPGITGLWQVLGRDGIPFEEMVKLDYVYVSTWSVFRDVKLILRTIPVLFRSNPC